MKKKKTMVKSIIVALIFTFGLGETLSAEKPDSGKDEKGSQKLSKSTPDLPLTSSGGMTPAPLVSLEGSTSVRLVSLEGAPLGQLKDSTSNVSNLEERIARLEAANITMKENHAQEMKRLYDHIAGIIHNRPPVFRELITTNKILWSMMGYSLVRGTMSIVTAYEQTGSYPYALFMGAEGAFSAFVTAYYVGLVLAQLSTLSSNIPAPAPTPPPAKK